MIEKKYFDRHPCGIPVYSYLLKGKDGLSVNILNFGAILQGLHVKNRAGKDIDVIGGFDKLESYLLSHEYQGAAIGRVANRLKNASFYLDGKFYNIFANEGKNVCHGGKYGFNAKFWDVEEHDDEYEPYLILKYMSPDMEESFPGNLNVQIMYKIKKTNSLEITFEAMTDKTTIINMTNHSYFNLAGYDSGNVLNHDIRINSSKIIETDKELIPTGKFIEIKNTPFDLNSQTSLEDVISSSDPKIMELNGLDTNFVLDNYDGRIKHQADFYCKTSGINMKVYTDQSSILIYTANRISEDEPNMKNSVKQIPHFGACFEAQSMPDSINNKGFDDIILNPGDKYKKTTEFEFSIM